MRWIDVKLACRMMFRYPVLTLVACVAIGVGIPCALVPLQMAHALNRPLPFDDGERIVGFDYSMVPGQAERNPGLLDLDRWRSSLTTVHELGGAVIRTESVRGDDGLTEIVRGAEVTASFVSLTRMKPIHGRLLRPEDEAPGEPAVAVIAFDAWQTFFKGAPDAIGKTLRFGRTYRTVVGVMPEGFLYPYREHFWVPLQARADAESVQGRRVIVLGRLAPGVSEAQAQTELAAVDRPDGAEDVRTSEQPRVRLTGAAQAITDLHPPRTATGSSLLYFFGLLLVGVTCGNVATLTLARGAARSTEIAVRRALGAGRGRIVMQQFVEALLLALVAALLGLGLLALAANRVELLLQRMPYWFDVSVQPFTVAAAAGFALFSAFVAGVLPALKLTRTEAYLTLQRQAAGATVRFGLAATVLIVVEVGIAVGGLSGVASVARGAFVNPSLGDGLVPERFLTAELGGGRIQSEVARRLREEGEVQAVSFAGRLPGMDHPRGAVDIESLDGATGPVQREAMRWTAIDRDFFDTLEQPMLAGRGFEQRDLAATPRPVVVNRSFVTQAFGASNPLGRRIRATVAPGQPAAPWREIVGVVNDLGMNVTDPSKAAGVYYLVDDGQLYSAMLIARIRGDAIAFAPRLRSILTSLDADIVMENPVRLDLMVNEKLWEARLSGIGFGALALIAIILSSAGLYALMAFSVTQRTREIAIRVALGARPASIARGVLARALRQLFAGVALGAALGLSIVPDILNADVQASDWRRMLAAIAFGMIVVGLLACAMPTRRALRIQPIDALKDI